jgi:putative Flp pilus-assembly TadE/G-like protein
MNRKHSTQRGQALILVALAIVGLVGFAALAIDGGNIFSDRRHAQNAADTAALAAALARVRVNTADTYATAGENRAADNGYVNDGVTEVKVHLCSDAMVSDDGKPLTCKGLPIGADPAQYVHVYIKSVVKLFFAPVLGWRHATNYTDAVARATIPEVVPWFNGNALVSTMTGCPPAGYPHDPFTVMGNSGTVIVNSGILVNSNCKFPDAFTQNGSSTVDTDNGVCVVGDSSYKSGAVNPPPTGPGNGCSQIDPSMYALPNPSCSHEGKVVEVKPKEYVAYPGLYGPNFDFDSISDVNPSGTLKLYKGIYCFYDGIDLQSTWDITTDWNNNHQHDSLSEGVFFFVPGGDISFNGSSTLNLHAVDSTAENFPEDFVNYLMYVPPTNHANIKITGANGSQFTGTILAPASYVVLNGGSGTVGLDSQVIGYAVTIEGNGTLDIHYNQDDNGLTTKNPGIEQTE